MEKISKSTVALAATALGLSLAGAGSAFAQDAEGGDIVVTARRIEERLQDVPISITVFNQQQLDDRNITNPADLANYTPGLSTNTQFGSTNASFAIRGFVQDNFTAPSVGVYFADVISPRGASSVTAGDGAGPGSMFDLQNVQVLKGPQGTLFGRNTTGGAILLVPQRPTSEFGGYLEATGGNFDLQHYQGVLNVPLSDNARMRIGVDSMERDGYLNNISGHGPDHLGDVNYISGRISFVADLTPNLENYSIFSYTHSNTNGFTQRVTDCNPNAEIFSNPIHLPSGAYSCAQVARIRAADDFYAVESLLDNPINELTQWQFINTTTWHATDNLTIKNIFSYAEIENVQRSSVFGNMWIVDSTITGVGGNTVSPLWNGTNTAISPAVIATLPGGALNHQNTLTEEIQFQGTALDNRLTWQAGAYYESSRPLDEWVGTQGFNNANCDNSQVVINGDPSTTVPNSSQCDLPYARVSALSRQVRNTEYTDMAIYGQGSYDLTDQLRLTLGLRYTDDESRARAQGFNYAYAGDNNGPPAPGAAPLFGGAIGAALTCDNPTISITGGIFNPLNHPIVPDCVVSMHQHSNATTGVIDLEYHPTDDLMIFGKYSRGYRQGLVNPRALPPNETFEQEQVDTYELGLKSSWRGPVPGYANVTTFYNYFQNQQLLISFVDSGGRTNAAACACGKSEIYGVEFDGSISLFDHFRLSGGLAYLHTELTEFATPQAPNGYAFIPGNAEGQPLTQAPEWKGTITAAYTLPTPESLGDMVLSATYAYTGDYITRTTDHGAVDAFNTLNLNFNWNRVGGSPVDFSLFGTNVTDEEYYTFSNDLYDLPALPARSSLGFVSKAQGEPRMWGARLRYHFGGEAH